MLHFAVSLGDAMDYAGQGRVIEALKTFVTRQNLTSMGAVLGNVRVLSRLAKLG
jgi:hypothetical protein